MRVLLTGHKGYIGCVLAPMLVRAGHDLTGLDSDLYCRCTFVGEVPKIPEIKKDVRDLELADVSGYDAVIHLAGLSSDPLGDLDPELTYAINHASSVRLAVLAKEAGVARFVFASTCSVYGAAGDQPIDETGTVRPLTPYGKSKWLVERDVSLLADSKFSPTFLRSATAYGVSPRLRFDLVLNNLVAWAHTTGQVYLKSDGTPWRPLVHVEDIARAYLAVLEASREKVHNKALNVGRNDENYRIGALAGFVVKTVPNCHIEYAEGAGPDKRCYRVDFTKISRILPAFQPQWDARKGVQELYDCYRNTSLKVEDVEGPKYSRVAHLKNLMDTCVLSSSLRWRPH